MIYRILISGRSFLPDYLEREETQWELGSDMIKLGLKPPPKSFSNSRARFYFTKRGWDCYGRNLVKRAKEYGLKVKVIRKKQPKQSDVVYSDEYQLAVLPSKK